MKITFDGKTNSLTIEGVSINPKANEPSGTGKTYSLGYAKDKVMIENREATVAVNVYVPVKKAKK